MNTVCALGTIPMNRNGPDKHTRDQRRRSQRACECNSTSHSTLREDKGASKPNCNKKGITVRYYYNVIKHLYKYTPNCIYLLRLQNYHFDSSALAIWSICSIHNTGINSTDSVRASGAGELAISSLVGCGLE